MSFRDLHVPGDPLVMPNPWDVGSAVMLESLGFRALATTSAGAAFAIGRSEGTLGLDGLLEAAGALDAAVSVPVSADLENGCGDSPDDAATAIRRAAELGLAGASIEDFSDHPAQPIYAFDHTIARAEAAIDAARQAGLVLTLRAEGMIHPNPDFDDVLARIRAYAQAGADVVFAPGLSTADQVAAVVAAAGDTPVSVLVGAANPVLTVPRLAALGVARISVGSALARVAYGSVIALMRKALDTGAFEYPDTIASFEDIETLLAARD